VSYKRPGSVTAQLDKDRNKPKTRSGQRKKTISGTSAGKWQTLSTLANYRRRRNRARQVAKASRKANRV
jgi:hypothetical protein